MAFLGIYKAVYDYSPQGDGELDIKEGDVLFVLEKSSDDDWWKAKKKAMNDDEDEPEGLIPANYIEEVRIRVTAVWESYKVHFADIDIRLIPSIRPKHYMITRNRQMRSYRLPKKPNSTCTTFQTQTGPW